MKSGKVNDMILNRSVIKNIKYRSKYGIVRPKVGNDAYVTQDGIVNASANAGLIFERRPQWRPPDLQGRRMASSHAGRHPEL